MRRAFLLVLVAAFGLAACTPAPEPARLGPDGKPLPEIFEISDRDVSRIQFRMLDSVNALRSASGLPELGYDIRLNAAAETHARDMSVQNRPWHFGSDGSSPIDRAQRAGYPGQLLGENISETYEDDVTTLAAWMKEPATRDVIMDPKARDMGFAWFQEPNGKIWWTLVTGGPRKVPGGTS
ncbi:hypothetical protein DDZ14_05305 [Maritimibacter sp. 55A14]|uniref:CAP domain-containing protein n=1 Tax=Maritimibacter sp. 55A14 TaxID=2174844 RepID=UPI000D60CD14|nr:CAP domain-containing protein [Maritimibacter sp. 55A14]PWE33604.1 hypothetical protein DDZ14_05305 [Maritimibacter sp. 55A14]